MAYNEASNIGRLLTALLTQETHSVVIDEIVVTASGCTDQTEAIVQGFAAREPRVHLLHQDRREGKASAINLFLQYARQYEIIVLQSADTLPVSHAIEALVTPFVQPDVGMAGGRPVPTNSMDTFLGYGVNLLWHLHHQVSLRHPKLGELIAFRNIFRQVPNDTAVDEASIEPLVIGQGMRLIYAPDAVVYNRGPETVGDYIKQRRRIFAGHLYVRDQLGYRVATLNGFRIAYLFIKNLKWDWRYFIWGPAIIALEVWVRLLGSYDYSVRKYNPYVWPVAESTKSLNETNHATQGK
jgi:cellulose synthase/poly-beta-1,6-N-acetylglucosamine synthase-like glycosyltransferase